MNSMKHYAPILATLLSLLLPVQSWGDAFQKGLDAYNSGDYATALKRFTFLAELGIPSAQYNLGVMYADGKGVLQDYKTAVKWYTLSAEQGDADAQNNLGYMYDKGHGVLQDYVRAHMWYNISASNGIDNGGKNRDIIAKQMTPSQIEKAQDLARECVAKDYKGC
jgi:TPR repeat protein